MRPPSRRPEGSKAQVMLSLTPHRDIPDDYTKNGGGMWPQCGASCRCRPNSVWPSGAIEAVTHSVATSSENPAGITAFLYLRITSFRAGKVDKNGSQSLYKFSWARRRLARWRVCEAPHCSHGERACGHALVAMFASPRRMCGLFAPSALPGDGRRGCKVPGCLTGESEERETWTAGSLRAASAEGNLAREWSGRDFGGRRFRSTPGHASDR
jgi:hypothetical protein